MFVVDALGALISAMLLGFVLPVYKDVFGIPLSTLNVLAIIPMGFVFYDLSVYFFTRSIKRLHLRMIAVLNILYCVVSLAYVINDMDEVTLLGWTYIIGEVLIVLGIAVYEWRIGFGIGDW